MVYKKYIKRGSKIFGPYYYKSYRENGKVKTRFISGPKEEDNKIIYNKSNKTKEDRIEERGDIESTNNLDKSKLNNNSIINTRQEQLKPFLTSYDHLNSTDNQLPKLKNSKLFLITIIILSLISIFSLLFFIGTNKITGYVVSNIGEESIESFDKNVDLEIKEPKVLRDVIKNLQETGNIHGIKD